MSRCIRKKLKIFNVIISNIAIDMMNDFLRFKRAFKVFFHCQARTFYVFILNSYKDISIIIFSNSPFVIPRFMSFFKFCFWRITNSFFRVTNFCNCSFRTFFPQPKFGIIFTNSFSMFFREFSTFYRRWTSKINFVSFNELPKFISHTMSIP